MHQVKFTSLLIADDQSKSTLNKSVGVGDFSSVMLVLSGTLFRGLDEGDEGELGLLCSGELALDSVSLLPCPSFSCISWIQLFK